MEKIRRITFGIMLAAVVCAAAACLQLFFISREV